MQSEEWMIQHHPRRTIRRQTNENDPTTIIDESGRREASVSSRPTLRCLTPAPFAFLIAREGGVVPAAHPRSLSTRPTSLLVPVGLWLHRRPTSAIPALQLRSTLPRPPSPSPSLVSVAHFLSLLACSGACLCAMRIRKGHRCLPMALPDRSSLQEGLVQGEKHARVVADDRKAEVNQTSPEPVAACAVADTSRGSQDQLLDLEKSPSSAGTERLEVDRGEERSSTSDEGSGKRTPVERRISISSIIRAGAASARNNLPSAPASAQSVVTSDTSVVRKGAEDCSPCVATKSMDDEPSALSQSLKRVCWAAASTGLTAKEAVGKIRELCLPGLNEGGERLIVQVAKAFRSSPAFVEREERGRYFLQDGPSPKVEWGNLDTGESKVRREKGSDDLGSVTSEAMEAARQLQNLQRMQEDVAVRVGSPSGGAEKNRAGGRAAVTAARSKSGASASSSGKASASWEHHESGPRCNRDDGKGWRCFRSAEAGFSLCKHHRDQIRRAELRRRRSRNKSKEQSPVVSAVVSPVKASNPRSKDVGKGAGFRGGVEAAEGNAIEWDDEVPDHKRRRFVKAKSLKSIM